MSTIDQIFHFTKNNISMEFAIQEAQQTLPFFFETFANPKENQTAFLLKVKFDIDKQIEHIWLADIDTSVFPLEGTIANDPAIESLSFMQRVAFEPTQITDWMYIEDDYLVGGYTIQAIRNTMTLEEREKADARRPYKIR